MLREIKTRAMAHDGVLALYARVRLLKDLLFYGMQDPHRSSLIWNVSAYTMASYQRLCNAYDLARQAESQKLAGAFVECGVWRGGCIGLMAAVAKEFGSRRKIWLFDSFEGLPEPAVEDGLQAHTVAGTSAGDLKPIKQCVGPLEIVKHLFFHKLKIDDRDAIFCKGWFQETLPLVKTDVGPIAVLRLDGDWYESTKICLDSLYDQVVPGGFVIIDDYGAWEGCRRAVDEFLKARQLQIVWNEVDYTGRYFVKPA